LEEWNSLTRDPIKKLKEEMGHRKESNREKCLLEGQIKLGIVYFLLCGYNGII